MTLCPASHTLTSGDVVHLEPLKRGGDTIRCHVVRRLLRGEVVQDILGLSRRQEAPHVAAIVRVGARLAAHYRDPAFAKRIRRKVQIEQARGFVGGGRPL